MNSSSLQDIVACLTYPVGDTPHQYVMERAIASAGLDCRYVTLEVAPEDLPTSLSGARASGVLGVSIAPMLEKAAGDVADGLAGDAVWTRHVDLITWRDKVATSKYTWGDAVVELLDTKGPLGGDKAIVWGEGPAAQAVAASLARNGFEPVTLVIKSEKTRAAVAAKLAESGAVVQICTADEADPLLHDDIGALVLADEPGNPRDAVAEYDTVDLGPRTAVIELYRHDPYPDLVDTAMMRAGQLIDSLDVLVQRLAIAFREWTGKEPNVREMRESLEEFWNV